MFAKSQPTSEWNPQKSQRIFYGGKSFQPHTTLTLHAKRVMNLLKLIFFYAFKT